MRRLMGLWIFLSAFSAWGMGDFSFQLPWVNHIEPDAVYDSTQHPASVFLVEAYFNTCPYCNDNAPFVNYIAAEYTLEPRVQFLDVGKDCKAEDYQKWIAKHTPNHPVLNDCKRTLLDKLGVNAYPTTFIIDSHGTVLYQRMGTWSNQTMREIRRVLNAFLKQP